MAGLTYTELWDMEGCDVIVKDLEYGYENQTCTVEKINIHDVGANEDYIQLILSNDNYEYCFNRDGTCADGEFEAYKIAYIRIDDETSDDGTYDVMVTDDYETDYEMSVMRICTFAEAENVLKMIIKENPNYIFERVDGSAFNTLED